MLQIFLCVLANVGLFIMFRVIGILKLNTFQAIVFNYITCVVTGLVYIGDLDAMRVVSFDDNWLYVAIVLGGIFISTFYMMAITTQKFSITVSSIASKMSLVVPVLFSLIILGIQSKVYTGLNYLGMILSIMAILMSSYKEKKIKSHAISRLELALPFLVFLMGGVIDSTINYTNYRLLTAREEAIFPTLTFASAATIGIVIMLFKQQKIEFRNVVGGVILGVINYFSIYFLITSLSAFNNDGALVYPLVNVNIIFFGAIISVMFFKERLSKINLVGLLVALISIGLMSYQELMQ